MNILITGAFGFVGSNVSTFLAARGHHLVAVDVALKEPSAYSKFYSWDQLEQIDWTTIDAVIHLAGKAHDTRNASDPQSYFDVNVGLTEKVISALVHYCDSALVERSAVGDQRSEMSTTNERMNSRTNELPKFIFFSSVKAVTDRVEGVLTEEALPNPQTPYGQSKLAAEGEVLKYGSFKVRDAGETTANGANQAKGADFRTLERQNFRTYILRPCMIHGPGNKGNLNLLYGVVSKGVPWPLGAFENRRSFASVGNVCAVVEGLLKGNVASGIYQVADDEALSTNELIGMMAETLGRRARVWKVPAGLVRAVARVGDVLRLPLNSERLKKLTESYVASNAKVKSALGWERMPVSASEGMRKTLESFPRQGAKTQNEETGPEGGERND